MCIQQPQDSSQSSAVIAHYNQSSQAHLSSPFWIRNGGPPPHPPQPNPSLQQIPLQLFVLHKPLLGEQNERSGQELCPEDDKAQGQDMVASEGLARGTACLRSARSCWDRSSCPWDSAPVPGDRHHTQELVQAAGQEPSPWAPNTDHGSPHHLLWRQKQSQDKQ